MRADFDRKRRLKWYKSKFITEIIPPFRDLEVKMRLAVRLLVALNLGFVLLLSLSGSIGGLIGEIIYILAFALPVFLGGAAAARLRREREAVAGVSEENFSGFGISGRGAARLLPLIAPTVSIVLLLSFLTSLILNKLGLSGAEVADEPLLKMLLIHALVPAVLEELTFRYIPIKLLYPYSPRWCVIYSALFFALIHCDLYKMPYAFVAGVIFVTVDIMLDSVLPSIILHFLNNLSSVLYLKYAAVRGFSLWYFLSLGTLTAVSVVVLIAMRKKYREGLSLALKRGSPESDGSPLALFILCFGIALTNLIL